MYHVNPINGYYSDNHLNIYKKTPYVANSRILICKIGDDESDYIANLFKNVYNNLKIFNINTEKNNKKLSILDLYDNNEDEDSNISNTLCHIRNLLINNNVLIGIYVDSKFYKYEYNLLCIYLQVDMINIYTSKLHNITFNHPAQVLIKSNNKIKDIENIEKYSNFMSVYNPYKLTTNFKNANLDYSKNNEKYSSRFCMFMENIIVSNYLNAKSSENSDDNTDNDTENSDSDGKSPKEGSDEESSENEEER